jgi:hypothetical protein
MNTGDKASTDPDYITLDYAAQWHFDNTHATAALTSISTTVKYNRT